MVTIIEEQSVEMNWSHPKSKITKVNMTKNIKIN